MIDNNDTPVNSSSFSGTKYIPVEGYKDFARDVTTGAIININHAAHLKAVKEKQKNQAKKKEFDDLKQEVSEIKDMLTQLLSKVNDSNGIN